LPGLLAAAARHTLEVGTPGDHDPPRSPTRGVASQAGAGEHRRLRSRVRPTSRCRGHDCARRAVIPAPTDPLLRTREDASGSSDDGSGDELGATAAMARG
jgi:hypothetical protein